MTKEMSDLHLQEWWEALEMAGDLLYRFDSFTGTLKWFGDAESCLGLYPDEVPATLDSFLERLPEDDRLQRQAIMNKHHLGKGEYDCVYRFKDSLGTYRWLHDRGALRPDVPDEQGSHCGVLRCIPERHYRKISIDKLDSRDELTALPDRTALSEILQKFLEADTGNEGGFLVLGLDFFARLNSVYGHEVGDAALVEIARRILNNLQEGDAVGRLGGDRFGLLLRTGTREKVNQVAQSLRDCIRNEPIRIPGNEFHLSTSIGGVTFDEQENHAQELMVKAESALFDAKQTGRDCINFFSVTDEDRQKVRTSMEVGNTVKRALMDDRLCLAYQPLVDAKSHAVNSHECLVRLQDVEGNLIPAAHFIPAVEQLGLTRLLDLHLLDQAVSDLVQYPDITLWLNISGLTTSDQEWLSSLVRQLEGRPEVARRLVIEITETAALLCLEDTARFVSRVRELGCRIALDDFGGGFSTFNHLKTLNVDLVKIDRSFVRNIYNSNENQLFLSNLLNLAHAFNLEALAEGVEEAEEAEYLEKMGIDLLQGYYFGMPEVMPVWRQ